MCSSFQHLSGNAVCELSAACRPTPTLESDALQAWRHWLSCGTSPYTRAVLASGAHNVGKIPVAVGVPGAAAEPDSRRQLGALESIWKVAVGSSERIAACGHTAVFAGPHVNASQYHSSPHVT